MFATSEDGRDSAGPAPRPVIHGAFDLLASLNRLGSARVSELQRDCGLPRTTVHRLLSQLAEVGAVERAAAGRWRLGATMVELGAEVPAQPHLRSLVRRPLMDLAREAGAYVAFCVELAGRGVIIEALPGRDRLAWELGPGKPLKIAEMAAARALVRARGVDSRPVIDVGKVDPGISCAAVPLRLPSRDAAAVWLMVPGGSGVPAPLVAAVRRTTGRIASALPFAVVTAGG